MMEVVEMEVGHAHALDGAFWMLLVIGAQGGNTILIIVHEHERCPSGFDEASGHATTSGEDFHEVGHCCYSIYILLYHYCRASKFLLEMATHKNEATWDYSTHERRAEVYFILWDRSI